MKQNLILPVLLILMLAGCRGERSSDVGDYSVEIYTPEYASGFEILGAEGKESVIINSKNPWQGAENDVRSIFIRRADESVPEGFSGEIIEGDAERIVCMSSTQIAMLQAVGADNKVVGVSGMQFISSPAIRSRSSEIGDVGFDGNINYEILVAQRPDLVLLYGVNSASSMEGKLKELGIPYMYVGDYLEESPLGKAEWMMAVAEAAGKRQAAIEVFSHIPQKYSRHRAKVDSIRGLKDSTPGVILNAPYGDTWYIPAKGSYIVQLIEDAGGEVIAKSDDETSTSAIDMEQAYRYVAKADYWLNVGSGIKNIDELKSKLPKFSEARVVKVGNVYDCTLLSTPGGGNDFYESGVMNPDLALRDLIKIFYPELISEPFVYYKKL